MIYRFPSDVKALVEIPDVIRIGIFSEEGGVPFEVGGPMDIQLMAC